MYTVVKVKNIRAKKKVQKGCDNLSYWLCRWKNHVTLAREDKQKYHVTLVSEAEPMTFSFSHECSFQLSTRRAQCMKKRYHVKWVLEEKQK